VEQGRKQGGENAAEILEGILLQVGCADQSRMLMISLRIMCMLSPKDEC
jgi:hypothetical protein